MALTREKQRSANQGEPARDLATLGRIGLWLTLLALAATTTGVAAVMALKTGHGVLARVMWWGFAALPWVALTLYARRTTRP